ncbi:fatty acid hydroxylase [Aquabacterium olei]|uniref:Fatty acid hydroxylase n=2 Tax=Pseudomonadota TaxID=1224 RepID=A0A2U8FRV9_9BURK|nr:sterol desaturase family protein [Aquabacterium olei]AWI53783.1 fatty acid hydroxylase [Aquabacterium olei]
MLDDVLIRPLGEAFGLLQQQLFEGMVQPLAFALGLGNVLEDAYDATGWMLVGVAQLLVMLLVLGPLQRWRPVERGPAGAQARVDVVYTLIHRLGLFRLALFFFVMPGLDGLFGFAAVHGLTGVQLDALMASWWPGVTDTAWAAFVAYLLVFDLLDYWIHRGQHRVERWWALHAVHHSQRRMTMWSDNRNHLLDDLLRDVLIALVARAVGVPPGQFVAVVACTQLIESLSHANVRLQFGWLGERLLVSPRFHRQHHAIGVGHEGEAGPGSLGGCNFAVLFPVWDIVFGTARFDGRFEATGIRDQLPEYGGRDYGKGFWSQQWLGLKRLLSRRSAQV